MKKGFLFQSIYAKFTLAYLGTWWFLNFITFGIVMYIMAKTDLAIFTVNRAAYLDEFRRIRETIGFAFLLSVLLGTIIILLVVRGVVKPIKRISKASKEVAKGNFEIEVPVKSKDEIGRLTADFNLMIQELKNIDVLRKDFVSNVSHEFKTPITSINGFAKLIRDGNLSGEQLKEYGGIIVDESERLSLLSSNILKLSELDSKIIREQAALFSLDEQIRKTVLILEAQWSKKEIEPDIELEKVTLLGNEHLLHEVWLNLIQNAIKFSNPQGIIKIRLQKIGDKARVEISDNGVGIAEEDKAHLFERFYMGDKSRSKDGNGLGLVIVKKIIEISGGEISFQSERGKGSCFIVELSVLARG